MKAGKLKHSITIQEATQTNTFGEITETWAAFATVRAGITNPRGGETFGLYQVHAESQVIFTIRYIKSVTTKMRIKYDSRIFDILAIRNPAEGDKMLIIECVEDV